MSYDSIKAGISALIKGLQLASSDEMIDFEAASPNQFGFTYILYPAEGDLKGEDKDSLGDRVYDVQLWELKIGYSRGTNSDGVNLDKLNRKREEVVKAIDNPNNWRSFARMLNVAGWKLDVYENYFVLSVSIEITDTITY